MGKAKRHSKRGSGDSADDAPSRPKASPPRLGTVLRVPSGNLDLASCPTRSTPGFDGDKVAGEAALAALARPLEDWQERLYAQGRVADDARRVLLVLQGMDTSGKGGVVRKVVSLLDPQGVQISGFGPPTTEERRHDFLWRIRRALPEPGRIGVFDRSHYEDVLVARVQQLTTSSAITRRYAAINRFEAQLVDQGFTIVKCFLHISPEEQRERLLARLDDPTKHWKFNPGDIDDRSRWGEFQTAYEIVLERCNTDVAPWHLVPSDRKWYRNWAVATLLSESLEKLAPKWPKARFDVAAEKRRLRTEDPIN